MRARAGHLGIVLAATLLASCSDPDDGSAEPEPEPIHDDDSTRLGHCVFDDFEAGEPGPPPSAAPVRAGFASEPLLLPIGTPVGGYGARSHGIGGSANPVDERAARWSTRFVPTVGIHDAPRVDALAIEAGAERMLLVRIDAPLVTDPVLFELERRLDPNGGWQGRIVLTASHSHAAWAAWQPSIHLVPGIDRQRRDLFEQALAVLERVAQSAIDSLAPASLGFASAVGLDPGDLVNHDRRGENDQIVAPDGHSGGAGEDPVWWALRVDRADGTPLCGVLSLPIHGTVGTEDNPLVSTDATGAIQRALSAELGYPVLQLQGAAGDVSPGGEPLRAACPDSWRCLDMPQLELLGAHTAKLAAPLISGISTRQSWAIEVVTRSFHVGKSALVRRPDGKDYYYLPYFEGEPDGVVFDEQDRLLPAIDEFNTLGGAALCGGAASLAPIAGTKGLYAYASCANLDIVFPVFAGSYSIPEKTLPLCDTVRATASAVRFVSDEDEQLLITLPGEPTAPYAGYLRSRSPAGPEHTLIVGYAQDYAGYLLTAEDWLAGGYEPSLNVWGPLEGEEILDQALAVAELAWSEERDPSVGGSRARAPSLVETPSEPVITTDHGTVPSVLPAVFLPDSAAALADAQPSASVPRALGIARFAWLGGDPALDRPEIWIERELSPGSFAPLVGARKTAASSESGAIVITYTPEPLAAQAPDHHYFVASWQPASPDPIRTDELSTPLGYELGRHRFRVRGRAKSSVGEQSYELYSAVFEVIPAPLGPCSATRGNGALQIEAKLIAGPGLRVVGSGASDLPLPLSGPWSALLKLDDGSEQQLSIVPDASGKALQPLEPTLLERVISIELHDPWGNGGSITVSGG